MNQNVNLFRPYEAKQIVAQCETELLRLHKLVFDCEISSDSKTEKILYPDCARELRRDGKFVVERFALFDERQYFMRHKKINIRKFRIAPEFI